MIIGVGSFKGGVATTTTAIHLAAYLNERASTLLVDEGPNKSSSDWAERARLPYKTIRSAGASNEFGRHSHYVIDNGARLDVIALLEFSESVDQLVLTTTPDPLGLAALLRTIRSLQSLPRQNYRVLLTITPPHPSRATQEARATLEDRGLPLFRAEIPRAVAYQKAARDGVVVHEARDPRAMRCWLAYTEVGDEILDASNAIGDTMSLEGR